MMFFLVFRGYSTASYRRYGGGENYTVNLVAAATMVVF